MLAYDQNGRVTARGDQTLEYTAQGKVAALNGPGVSLEMIYDADGQRVGRHDSANGGTVVTLDGVYERRFPDGLGEHRARYLAPLPSGSAIRVERTWDGGPAFAEETHFVHGDYLGSGEVVTDITGAVLAEASFDPWGAARDPEDWTSVLNEPDLVDLGVGFTGHRAELDGGLVNMGGRMYDPVVGRFTAPDPVVVDAANGQAYNRYAYVMNRPLRLVDPTGYAAEDPQGDDDDPEDGDDEAKDQTSGDELDSTGDTISEFDLLMLGLFIWLNGGPDNGEGQDEPPADEVGQVEGCLSECRWIAPSLDGKRTRTWREFTADIERSKTGETAEMEAQGVALFLAIGVLWSYQVFVEGGSASGEVFALGGRTVLGPGTAVAVGTAGTSASPLARALLKADTIPRAGEAAHHIVAKGAQAARPARVALQRLGIDIHSAANGVFLPANRTSPNPLSKAVHSTLHTNKYYNTVNQALESVGSRSEAIQALDTLRQRLNAGGL